MPEVGSVSAQDEAAHGARQVRAVDHRAAREAIVGPDVAERRHGARAEGALGIAEEHVEGGGDVLAAALAQVRLGVYAVDPPLPFEPAAALRLDANPAHQTRRRTVCDGVDREVATGESELVVGLAVEHQVLPALDERARRVEDFNRLRAVGPEPAGQIRTGSAGAGRGDQCDRRDEGLRVTRGPGTPVAIGYSSDSRAPAPPAGSGPSPASGASPPPKVSSPDWKVVP